jgi:hypothetical protein
MSGGKFTGRPVSSPDVGPDVAPDVAFVVASDVAPEVAPDVAFVVAGSPIASPFCQGGMADNNGVRGTEKHHAFNLMVIAVDV